ncbi:putative RNA-binding protein C22E12.02 [Pseudocercospora fuligena]|uniref:Putative RNA-binding protein C22E12.02 n=1 Tax=Pseudocercospora fuligena TaxID=685502 RepID=A0A8H6VNW3_9PEZI|nr:putative RNA-binding protein C22E12.02 [Pseudocercospora fuligena]
MARKNNSAANNGHGKIGRQAMNHVQCTNNYAEADAYQAQSTTSGNANFYSNNFNQQRQYTATAGYYPQHNMDYNQYANQGYGAYGYPPGYAAQYAQPQQQQYQATPPAIRNPFAPPPPPASTYSAQNANFDPDYEQQIAQWQSAYAPADQQDRRGKGKDSRPEANANHTPVGQRGGAAAGASENGDAKSKQDDSKFTVVRKGGGEQWEDKSLLEWDPTKFRIMVGNLAGEVTDDSLAKAFAQYGVSKARVVRDKRTTKSKGFGFVEFEEGELGFKAAREMTGKYIGSHPVTIQRSKTDVRPQQKKDNNKHRGKNNNNKNKQGKNDKDPLKAHTGAGIEKKPANKPAPGLKLLG